MSDFDKQILAAFTIICGVGILTMLIVFHFASRDIDKQIRIRHQADSIQAHDKAVQDTLKMYRQVWQQAKSALIESAIYELGLKNSRVRKVCLAMQYQDSVYFSLIQRFYVNGPPATVPDSCTPPLHYDLQIRPDRYRGAAEWR